MTFRVTLRPSGHVFDVQPNQTILNAALAAGYSLPYSCRTGCCNTCKGRVLEGAIDQGLILEKNLPSSERDRGFTLLCSARATSNCTIEVHELVGLAAVEPKLYPARIAKLERPAPDVAVLHLRMPLNENMHYLAGQYIELISNGVRRSYSIANAPNPEGLPFLELHVQHVPGGIVSNHICTVAKERDLVKLEGPFGTFFLRDSAKPVILLASGTGFAPIKAIVEETLRRGSQRDLTLYWGGNIYAHELAASWPIKFIAVTERYVQDAVLRDHADLSAFQVYACGSPRMVDAARREFTARGLPADEFFADAFITTADQEAK